MKFASWWENKGVAPTYKPFAFAIRLQNSSRSEVFLTSADLRKWLPGDAACDGAIALPDLLAGGDVICVSVGILSIQYRHFVPKAEAGRSRACRTMGKIRSGH